VAIPHMTRFRSFRFSQQQDGVVMQAKEFATDAEWLGPNDDRKSSWSIFSGDPRQQEPPRAVARSKYHCWFKQWQGLSSMLSTANISYLKSVTTDVDDGVRAHEDAKENPGTGIGFPAQFHPARRLARS